MGERRTACDAVLVACVRSAYAGLWHPSTLMMMVSLSSCFGANVAVNYAWIAILILNLPFVFVQKKIFLLCAMHISLFYFQHQIYKTCYLDYSIPTLWSSLLRFNIHFGLCILSIRLPDGLWLMLMSYTTRALPNWSKILFVRSFLRFAYQYPIISKILKS
jgi:hypothetical protein